METSNSEIPEVEAKSDADKESPTTTDMMESDSVSEPAATQPEEPEVTKAESESDIQQEQSLPEPAVTEETVIEAAEKSVNEPSKEPIEEDAPMHEVVGEACDSNNDETANEAEAEENTTLVEAVNDVKDNVEESAKTVEALPVEAMEVQEQEKDKDTSFAAVLIDENSENSRSYMESSDPIEEVESINKEDSNDAPPDLGAADPLMKDAEIQAEGDETPLQGDESRSTLDEKPDVSDRIMLSVKPPGELMEGNFVDVADENSMPDDGAMDYDPIETENDPNEPAEGDIFNGKEAETILAEDDTEVPSTIEGEAAAVGPEGETVEDANKFVITAANRTEKSACSICAQEEVPQYLAHKNKDCECICSTACLDKFKEQHTEDYIERILRLRGFATEEPMPREEAEVQPVLQEEDTGIEGDPFRKCIKCQKCIDIEDYLTWEAQDYCGEACLVESQRSINSSCARCDQTVPTHLLGKYCVRFGTTVTQFCRTSCLISYKKARKLCQFCQQDLKDDAEAVFCSKRCKEAANPAECEPKEAALCSVCRQVKPVELNVRGDAKVDAICSERCLVAYKFVNKIELVKCVVCPTTFLRKPGDPSVHELDAVHSLCSRECQKIFLITHRKIVNCCMCLVKKYDFDMIRYIEAGQSTSVCSLTCLNVYFECTYSQKTKKFQPNIAHLQQAASGKNYVYGGKDLAELIDATNNVGKMAIQVVMMTKPRAVPRQRNKAVMCQPRMLTKAIQHKVKERNVYVQTEDTTTRWIPIPVPIFVPAPVHMYVQPIPLLTPIPIPLIIPIFILTGRKSMKGIAKEIAKIKNRIPADPLEAEILMMADMAAGDKRNEPTSDSDEDTTVQDTTKMLDTSMSQIDAASTSFSDDVLSMAFKMANEYTEPLDLESEVDNSSRMLASGRRPRNYAQRGSRSASQRMMDIAKPDEHLSLKYTFGVNAWKQWASIKNLELQKLKSSKFVKLDLLQLSAEDLCYCLCQFVKEVRKPSGAEYAADTIYYLCLGIQLYLYENGRIDNLFCDSYYDKFTDTFNEICLSFCQLYNDSQYIVTRVEEEHLWESKQLGAHSPLVLLNTLLFFNTKHFNLTTVDDHLQLSFSHIMKHWKRNANAPNQRNVLLRFYPPSKGAWGKRKVYEQQECLENPLRCPVRLYEFFLSKCPESVKTRNDVFYLQPERSCVPDSPVWYSTCALEGSQIEKMLNRMKMIKEISMAILGT